MRIKAQCLALQQFQTMTISEFSSGCLEARGLGSQSCVRAALELMELIELSPSNY